MVFFLFFYGGVWVSLFFCHDFSVFIGHIFCLFLSIAWGPSNLVSLRSLIFLIYAFGPFFHFFFFYIVIILKKDNVNINSMRKIIEDFRIDVLIVKHIESIFKNFRIFWKDVENHGNGMNALKIYFLDFLFFLIYFKKKVKNWIMIWMMEFTISH
jgi:hypothetical protein